MFPLTLALFAVNLVETVEVMRNVELTLRIVEGFERGPVILELSITNRGKNPLFLGELGESRFCSLKLPEDWKVERRFPWGHCFRGDFAMPLDEGKTFTQRRTLHKDYLSAFPAGDEKIEVCWKVMATGTQKWEYSKTRMGPGRVVAWPTKAFSITIAPATLANRLALAARFEREFAQLPAPSVRDKDDEGPYRQFCDKVLQSPHKELMPLLVRLLDRVPRSDDWEYARLAGDIAETMLAADAAKAQRILVDYLLASPQVNPHAIFSALTEPHWRLRNCMARLFIITNYEFYLDRRIYGSWEPFKELQNLARWSQEMAPRMLPDAELKRLAGAKDSRVRELVSKSFGEHFKP